MDGVLLSEKTALQLIDALREYLKEPLLPRRTPRYANQFPGQTSKLAVTTSTISAASGTTPGSGTATIQLFNGSTYSAISAAYATVTVFNTTSSTVPSGTTIQVKRIDGHWFVDVASC